MTEHFTRNTVSAMFYCGKCGRSTMHRIDGVRKGPCLECMKRLEDQHLEKQRTEKPPEQVKLFA